MDSLISTFFWGFVWGMMIYFALKFISLYLKSRNEILAEQLEGLTKQLKEQIIHVNIEKHGSVFYLFEKDTDRFIAQGTSIDEVKEHCLARFKDKTVVADELQMEQLGFK